MSLHIPIRKLKISIVFEKTSIPIGQLAIREHKIYFEYNASFLTTGLSISPFKLPLESGLHSFNPFLFDGLPGVFYDCLPDGWGRLLVDRFIKSQNLLPAEFSSLDRLAMVGKSGLGALIFEPDRSEVQSYENIDLNTLSEQTQTVLRGESDDVLETLINLNGSSAGARPKALLGINKEKTQLLHGVSELPPDFDHWIVKFANSRDGFDAGAIEYVYSIMAREAGIEMYDTHLFPSTTSAGYFGIKRFDRLPGGGRLHMHSASGLLHSDFRTPALDYENLIALTEHLTRDVREVEKLFRLAVFNVLAHNRDDHGKNFSFLMNPRGEWRLSPAYDLTFSSGPAGHQSTMVMGEGKSPNERHLKQLGAITHLSKHAVTKIIDQTKFALKKWPQLAQNHGVSKVNTQLIQNRLII